MIPVALPPLREGVSSNKEIIRALNALLDEAGRMRRGTFTWDPGSIAANTVVDTTFTVTDFATLTGNRAGMFVEVVPPSTLLAGLDVEAWVAADDELTVRLKNTTGGALNTASGTWAFFGWLVA